MANFNDGERQHVRLKIAEGTRSAEIKTYSAQQVAELLKRRIRAHSSAN